MITAIQTCQATGLSYAMCALDCSDVSTILSGDQLFSIVGVDEPFVIGMSSCNGTREHVRWIHRKCVKRTRGVELAMYYWTNACWEKFYKLQKIAIRKSFGNKIGLHDGLAVVYQDSEEISFDTLAMMTELGYRDDMIQRGHVLKPIHFKYKGECDYVSVGSEYVLEKDCDLYRMIVDKRKCYSMTAEQYGVLMQDEGTEHGNYFS